MIDNFSIIVLGATGDLAQKKLFPAILRLIGNKKIGENFSIIGAARKSIQKEEFLEHLKKRTDFKRVTSWEIFEKHFNYQKLDFENEGDFAFLSEKLSELEKTHNTKRNRLFYLATLPEHFRSIALNLKKHKLTDEKNNWCRVVFEKPFGEDRTSAKKLNDDLKKVFNENQIYRIDHYLGKELVQNIAILRAANRVFSPLWNKENIDHIQINLVEDFGVETRGNFYDKEGALRDVGQNHMLQLLCLTAMEIPKKFNEKYIRDEKMKVLKSLSKPTKKDIVLGQYEGFSKEKGVNAESKTETFFAMKLLVNNKRWKGTPFFIRSGKNLGHKFASVYVQFKEPNQSMFENQNLNHNYLLIQIQPDDGILVQLNGKSPGEKLKVNPVKMTFCHKCAFGINTPEAYETLIHNALEGDQSAFIRSDEIEESWKLIDEIKKLKTPVQKYSKGSFGPKKSEALMPKGTKWFNKSENVFQGI
ncbi:MAG: glucose-6-phosphate dehydrogenase [Candidatus Diapherotrites archaeon CG11_big_fil_rev_8_21_14_0_20_37_9]|nr:MAG: glucose-6-phosphate dehydrogenase [Candidatus Diapherotrites archaeon CG11_big_fil_rev_8_21_14_0_20_37_9]